MRFLNFLLYSITWMVVPFLIFQMQVLPTWPVLRPVSFTALCTAAYVGQCERACIEILETEQPQKLRRKLKNYERHHSCTGHCSL